MNTSINDQLKKLLPKHNIHSLPKVKKVVLNYRVSDSRDSQEALNTAETELMAIAGQKPRLCRAKKSVATFKLRQNEPLAYKVTLRGARMNHFIEKLFNIVLPRLRDFKGLPDTNFDSSGNYNLTLKDQTFFPEIDLDKVNKIRSLQITINIAASSVSDSKMLLSALGFPFQKD
ncbi:MAG TPA: 50S ribosomal protein L5 [Candidatus Woesebacteria bacterium]|nr:50S ribosomal protein L5 [Candidatus Woesebacteria bacterium]